MDATPHLVAGAAVGARRHPVMALLLGVASNAVLDAIPHHNLTGWRPFSTAMVVDGVVGGALVLMIMGMAKSRWGALCGAAGGILPEVERLVSGHGKDFLARPPLGLPQFEAGPPLGILTQVLVTVLALVVTAAGRRSSARKDGRVSRW